MSQTPTPALAYATRETAGPRRRWFHAWVLPLLWLPGGIGACYFYGDEYSAFGGAHLPVVLVLDRFSNLFRTIEVGMIVTVVIGAVLLALVGVALASVVFWTMFFLGWCWGVYALAGVAIVSTPIVRVLRRG